MKAEGSKASKDNGLAALIACLVVSFVFGTVHSFSSWLLPLELEFSASRTIASLSYSIALVSITLAVFMGSRIFHRILPHRLAIGSLVLGLVGVAFAASGLGIWAVWIGYGLVFGFANGLGYGFALQFAAIARPGEVGWAMGLVTASYACGAMALSGLFAWVAGLYGPSGAMGFHGVLLVFAIPLVYFLLRRTQYRLLPSNLSQKDARPTNSVVLIWLAYGFAVWSGLMVISQASEIMRWMGAGTNLIANSPGYLALLNLLGALLGGAAVDRISSRSIATMLPVAAALAMAAIILVQNQPVVFASILIVAFLYGATIAAYPAIIVRKFGAIHSTYVYGRVFTAWGAAGLAAPVVAGVAFDKSGSYEAAFYAAGAAALLSAILARRV